jgi:DNA-binding HxlR family transcriptional regulator
MKRSELGGLVCNLASALAEVGDAWSLLIVKEIMLRNRRFDGIAAQTGISESALASRLKRLEDNGAIERRPYQERPTRYEYRLTEKGADLWPTLVALTGWGDRWSGRETAPLVYQCAVCGHDAHPRLACEACGAALDPRTVAALQSGAMQEDRARRARR